MPRSRKTTRGIVLVAFVAAAGVLVAACTPPLPPDVLAAKAENQITCQNGELTVSVPEDFTGSMDAVGQALAGVCPDQKVTEAVNQADAPLRLVDKTPSDAEIADFVARSRTGTMATIGPDGQPHLVAMWYGVIDGEIWVETKAKSQKTVNVRRNPRVSFLIEDGQTYDTLRGAAFAPQQLSRDPFFNRPYEEAERSELAAWEKTGKTPVVNSRSARSNIRSKSKVAALFKQV